MAHREPGETPVFSRVAAVITNHLYAVQGSGYIGQGHFVQGHIVLGTQKPSGHLSRGHIIMTSLKETVSLYFEIYIYFAKKVDNMGKI